MGIFKPNSCNTDTHVNKNYTADSYQILNNDKHHQVLFEGGPKQA